MADIRFQRLTGRDLQDHLDGLARLRIEVFRDFPYLYSGSADYEQNYLATYAATSDSVIIGAFDGDRLIGAATGLPLAHEMDSVKDPFARRGIDPESVFYFGESVLLRPYRGRGIGVAFFRHREDFVHSLGRFDTVAFCAVVRSPDHPRRPADYAPLDGFWRRRGYEPMEDLVGVICWQDLGDDVETAKPMQFWIKRLRPASVAGHRAEVLRLAG
jgi:GNAT superfamily N-acetyltransferase